MIYTKICIEKSTGIVVNRYRGNKVLTNKYPKLYEWVKWGKEMPEMIDSETGEEIQYIYQDKELVRL